MNIGDDCRWIKKSVIGEEEKGNNSFSQLLAILLRLTFLNWSLPEAMHLSYVSQQNWLKQKFICTQLEKWEKNEKIDFGFFLRTCK